MKFVVIALLGLSAIATGSAQAKEQAPSSGKAPAGQADPNSFEQRFTVITSSDMATLLPRASVLNLPPKYAERLKPQRGLNMVSWTAFLAANRGWIRTQEVSFDQLQGKKPLSPEVLKSIAESSSVVIATNGGAPVGVAKPKTP